MTDYIDVYVSAGQNTVTTSPFYTFYLEDSNASQTITTLNTNAKYRFHRLTDPGTDIGYTSHPFYISDNGANLTPSNKIMIMGNGTSTDGIEGTESFTLEFTGGSSGLPTSLYYYCTSHSNMVGDFFELDLDKHTWVDNYYVVTKNSPINKVKGTIDSGKYLYIQKDIGIEDTQNFTVAAGGNLIVPSADSSEYTALDDNSIFTIRNDYFSSDANKGTASFLLGGSNAAYGPIELWNTGAVTNMQSLFSSKNTFNKDISGWNVGNVTSMHQMFQQAFVFNQPLGSWNTANVNTFRRMFANAEKFNQPIGTWNVSKAGTDSGFYSLRAFEEMFNRALNFNQNIADWEREINQPLPSNTAINATSTSTVRNVPDMSDMFNNATNFNQPIDNWDVSAVTTMQNMFKGASSQTTTGNTKFNQYLGSWGYKFGSPITSDMFKYCAAHEVQGIPEDPSTAQATWAGYSWPDKTLLNYPLTQDSNSSTSEGGIYWAVSQLGNSGGDTSNFDKGGEYYKYGSVSEWNVNNITNMSSLFKNKSDFNENIGFWMVSNVNDMKQMFNGATDFNNGGVDSMGSWIVSSVTSMYAMFKNAAAFNRNISDWERASNMGPGSSLANCKNMGDMFYGATIFDNGGSDFIGNWNVSAVTDMYGVFRDCEAFNRNISDWEREINQPLPSDPNTSATSTSTLATCKSMVSMFSGADLFNQDIGDWNVSAVTNMGYMFYNTYAFEQSLSKWSLDSIDEDPTDPTFWTQGMFTNSKALNTFSSYNLPASPVKSQWITYWPTTPLTDGSSGTVGSIKWARDQWFADSTQFNNGGTYEEYGTIDKWNTSQVTNMSYLFNSKATFNEDITAWDVSQVENFSNMFAGAKAFNKDIGDWNVTSATTMQGMFNIYQPTSTFSNLNIGNWERVNGVNGATSTSTMANVVSMRSMFTDNDKFNKPIGNWNISGCEDFYGMFFGAMAFYQDLKEWANTGGGFNSTQSTGQNYSFKNFLQQYSEYGYDRQGNSGASYDANLMTLQTQVLGGGSFTASGTDAGNGIPELINGAGTAPVAATWLAYNWTIPKTALIDGSSGTVGSIKWARDQWFADSTQFNNGGTYEEYGTIDKWNTSQVTNMSYLFNSKATFNEDITAWDVSQVENFSNMFAGAKAFDQDIGAWTIKSGQGVSVDMSGMFNIYQPTSTFSNLNIGNWERVNGVNGATSTSTMANVVSMRSMFTDNDKFNKPIGNWNISGCEDFYGMFFGAMAFYQDLKEWANTGGGFNSTQSTGQNYSFKNFLQQYSEYGYDRQGNSGASYDANLMTLQTRILGGGSFTASGTDAGNGIPELTSTTAPRGPPVTATWLAYNWP